MSQDLPESGMVAHILADIPLCPDFQALLQRTHVKPESASARELRALMEEGVALAKPKAAYLVAYVTGRGDDFVEIEGVRFDSRVLAVNLSKAYRVFPYLATCGMELQNWADGMDDMLRQFWAESLKEMALTAAFQALERHIEATYRPGDASSMSPGSLPDWLLQQQVVFFALMGAHSREIGVTLTPSLLMVPTKTVSGIRFPTTEHFESCQLCPRENCPGRRAPYDAELYAQRFQSI